MCDSRTHFMAVVYGYWAKGETKEKALEVLKKKSGKKYRPEQILWYKIHPDTIITTDGIMRWPVSKGASPADTAPMEIPA